MQEPLPALTFLYLGQSTSGGVRILPKAFLGGSAPQLRSLCLVGVPFPALPKLLLSTSHKVTLQIHEISIKGYISPGAMAACLAALPNLKDLSIQFAYYEYRSIPPIQNNTHWLTGTSPGSPSFSLQI